MSILTETFQFLSENKNNAQSLGILKPLTSINCKFFSSKTGHVCYWQELDYLHIPEV